MLVIPHYINLPAQLCDVLVHADSVSSREQAVKPAGGNTKKNAKKKRRRKKETESSDDEDGFCQVTDELFSAHQAAVRYPTPFGLLNAPDPRKGVMVDSPHQHDHSTPSTSSSKKKQKTPKAGGLARTPSGGGNSNTTNFTNNLKNYVTDPAEDIRINVDMSDFNDVLMVDLAEMYCDVEANCTIGKLVAALKIHKAMPTVVPELKSITVGGAFASYCVSSGSVRNGRISKFSFDPAFLETHQQFLDMGKRNV